ncbi:MAG: ADP-ribosyl-[dinitrogen reductase] hydrolase [Rhodothermales bacterium]|jgi:ADP-ribosyl-[dinitrogen reductase] hydrolase
MDSPYHQVLLGTAVGDAIGLPVENLPAAKIAKRFAGPLHHSLILGRGMCSDDSEQTVMLAQALLAYPDDSTKFAVCFQRKLRWWLAAVPAGVGFGTLRAILLGRGVNSAGNGGAMRAAILGVHFKDDPIKRRAFVDASARVTHTHPHAIAGARVVAEFATLDQRPTPAEFADLWRSVDDSSEWQGLADKLAEAMALNHSVAEFASAIDAEGFLSGWVMQTVPVACFAWWRHFGDYRATIEAVVRCGGDTDSTAAIAGALAALAAEIPDEWIAGIWEWPRSIAFLGALGDALQTRGSPVPTSLWLIPLRNLVFLAVILAHIPLRWIR